MVWRHRATVELWGRAPRTVSRKASTGATVPTFHLERSPLNLAASMNCDGAGARAAVSEEAAPAAAQGLR